MLSLECPPAFELPYDTSLSGLDHFTEAIDSLEDNDPYFCGLAGYLAYELAPLLEPAASIKPLTDWHLVRLVSLDACYVADHQTGTASLQFRAEASQARRSTFQRALSHLDKSGFAPPQFSAPVSFPSADFSQSDYVATVRQIKEEIAAGEYYECNFTQRFRALSETPPPEFAARLFAQSLPPHAACLDFGDEVIVSASPELFLELRDDEIITRPIKGSITSHFSDARTRLKASPKDRAEHTMVIDLARNDLGRICAPGSIKVEDEYSVEDHPGTHHMVSTVRGTINKDLSPLDILRATFPAASITGAPKIRVMKAIAAHERSPRGVYTGSIGWFNKKDISLNVAIRTAAIRPLAIGFSYQLGSGGAIVSDSDPKAEYEECLMKIKPLAAAMATP